MHNVKRCKKTVEEHLADAERYDRQSRLWLAVSVVFAAIGAAAAIAKAVFGGE